MGLDVLYHKRVDFLKRLGIEKGSTNYSSVLDGPVLCTLGAFGEYFLQEPTDRMREVIRRLEDKGENKVVHIVGETTTLDGTRVSSESYLLQNLDEEDYGGLNYGEADGSMLARAYVESTEFKGFSEIGGVRIRAHKGIIMRSK